MRAVLVLLLVACGDDVTNPIDGGGSGPDGPSGAADAPPPTADGSISGGTLIFEEPFEDTDYASRGWYDSNGGNLSDVEHAPGGSTRSFECDFQAGATSCAGGLPARHPVAPTESVYLRLSIKFSANWVGSGQPYHPHMFHFVTDADGDYVGPAATHLTTYAEIVGGTPMLGLQDSLNVDTACVLRNDDSFAGCNGDFASYPFTEMRSVASCNGLAGDLDGRDCFPNGGATWYSARMWYAPAVTVTNDEWHLVEVYYQMNTIQAGVGVPDGRIRWWLDGVEIIGWDHILFRTGANATIAFDQFLMLPYIGDGSPIDQQFWVDDLSIWTAPP